MTEQEGAALRPHLCIAARPQAVRENILRCGDTRVTVLTDRLFRIERGSFTYASDIEAKMSKIESKFAQLESDLRALPQ